VAYLSCNNGTFSGKEQIRIEDLFPGRTYICNGEVVYTDFKNKVSQETPLKITTDNLNFTASPDIFYITVSFENPNHFKVIIYYSKDISKHQIFDSIVTRANIIQIRNLEMSTDYRICLSVYDEGCPQSERDCQYCETVTTKEGLPFPPSNLTVTELSNGIITISWSPPEKHGGQILKYKVTIKGQCKVRDIEKCPDATCDPKVTESFPDSSIFSGNIDSKPYWNYEISVSAVSFKGVGSESLNLLLTERKSQLPVWKRTTNIESIEVTIIPKCPYTGQQTYIIEVSSNMYHQKFEREYDIERNKTELKPLVIGGLSPEQNYKVCILVLFDEKEECFFVMTTSQISPKNAPLIQKKSTNESDFSFLVTRPEKSYPKENEILTYHFWIQSECISTDKNCNNLCHEEYQRELKTIEKTFQFSIAQLKPYWQYRFRSMVENEVGTGPLSNWTKWYKTPSITNAKLGTKEIIFATSSSDDSVILTFQPSCQYQGNASEYLMFIFSCVPVCMFLHLFPEIRLFSNLDGHLLCTVGFAKNDRFYQE
jgi:hypothetical protein